LLYSRRQAGVLNQKKGELFDDAANKLHQLMEGWDNRLTFENIAESYFKSKVRVLIKLRAVLRLHSEQFCAVFEYAGDINQASVANNGNA
jgi:hypothetical protein